MRGSGNARQSSPWAKRPTQVGSAPRDDDDSTLALVQEELLRLENEVEVHTHRVESYTIEAALFGGLTFAAFVTAVTARPEIIPDIGNVLDGMLRGASALDVANLVVSERLLTWIGLTTLITSAIYSAVIIARIPCYRRLERVAHPINVGKMFVNEVLRLQDARNGTPPSDHATTRAVAVREHIRDELSKATERSAGARRIISLLRHLRIVGAACFAAVLVVSGFVLHWLLGGMLTAVFVWVVARMLVLAPESAPRHRRRVTLQSIPHPRR